MKYMGSKAKYAKYLLPYILADRKPNQYYVEPFVGGCNMMDKVSGNRIGYDNNLYLIAMWKGLKFGYEKPIVNRETYNLARTQFNTGIGHLTTFEIGYIGWMGSFNGRFFDGGFSGQTSTRDYIAEQIRNTEKQVPMITDVHFINKCYSDIHDEIPTDSIIYCDPPYKGTKQYSTSKNFDHDHFWEWCREQKNNGHQVFVSEYEAPNDFKCLVSLNAKNSLNTTKTYNTVEKLFTI